MTEMVDVQGRWPELFEGMTDSERKAVVDTFASDEHEGFVPTREDVVRLTSFARQARLQQRQVL